jgi:hypothetical protein
MQPYQQALPFAHTLQQAAKPDAAHAGAAQLMPAGPTASDTAATTIVAIFMTLPLP